ncbi:MAG: hypothetical protein EZS28_009564 [Streblomastix strix]|uniref:Uncharacterized protein n=1 Tax=Streblomastix strix TaxID=222440 RepID=A0A5J4WJ01_9EUKA|nr:MAG: hypothetical protein EZS28_009564 [Streblomastix strix]
MRLILNLNEGGSNDIHPPNTGPQGQNPPGQRPTGPHSSRNAIRSQASIFPPLLAAEQKIPEVPHIWIKKVSKDHIHRQMLKGFDLALLEKDDEDQYWPGFGLRIPHAIDWRKSKQSKVVPSMGVKAFWRIIRIEEKVGLMIQTMNGRNAHKWRKILLKIMVIEIQPAQKTNHHTARKLPYNPNHLFSQSSKYNKYKKYNRNNKPQFKYQNKKDRKDVVPNKVNIGEQEIIQEKSVALQGEKKLWNI